MTTENNEKSYEEILGVKEEGKFKSWVKKHKTTLAVGSTALVGAGVSVLAYRMGYKEGYSKVNLIEGIKAFDEGVKSVKDEVSGK